MDKPIIEEEIICESKPQKKQPSKLIVTVKKICIYNERQREYKYIELTDILSWSYLVSKYKFIFEISGEKFITEFITNDDEIYNALCNMMPEKCRNLYEEIGEDIEIEAIISYEDNSQEFSLNKNEKIVYQAKISKPTVGILGLGLVFIGFVLAGCFYILPNSNPILFILLFCGSFGVTGILIVIFYFKLLAESKNVSITLTNQRIFIYINKQKIHLGFNFEDIISWKHNGLGWIASFTFETSKGIYKTEDIKKFEEILDRLNKIMPEKYIDHNSLRIAKLRKFSMLDEEFDNNIDLKHENNFEESGINSQNKKIKNDFDFIDKNELYDIVLNETGPNKYEIMRLIRNYTLEDLSQISEKLNKLPCVIIKNATALQTEKIMKYLIELGADVSKK